MEALAFAAPGGSSLLIKGLLNRNPTYRCWRVSAGRVSIISRSLSCEGWPTLHSMAADILKIGEPLVKISTRLPPSCSRRVHSFTTIIATGGVYSNTRKASQQMSVPQMSAMPALGRTDGSSLAADAALGPGTRLGEKRPVLLLDVMGTLVRDPFYDDIPRFFGLTMVELLQQKHPSAWVEFETGHITESELVAKFFSDGREFDYTGLKACVKAGYAYLEGVEDLLGKLKTRGYSMHAFTNYPCWYQMIEEKLLLSQYLPWTFVSCQTGRRKPDLNFYLEAARHLDVDPRECLFVDDRPGNVDAAVQTGMKGIVFTDTHQLERELRAHGVDV